MVRAAIRNEAEAVAELARLNRILVSTPLDDKRRLSDTREAIRDLELRLDAHRRTAVSTTESLIETKEAELIEAKARLSRLEKLPSADKVSLSNARSKVGDAESALRSLRARSNVESGRLSGMTRRY